MAKDIVYTHHEWWDGRGYPRGLEGTAIPIAGRLVAVVAVYDAMTARRRCRQPLSHQDAVDLIIAGKQRISIRMSSMHSSGSPRA